MVQHLQSMQKFPILVPALPAEQSQAAAIEEDLSVSEILEILSQSVDIE